jgi:hypothetical protein
VRTHVYQAMAHSAEVLALFTGDDGVVRIYEASSLDIVPPKPFCTYRMHTHFPLIQGHGQREYCQIWVHDIPGDYLTIDDGLAKIRRALESWPAQGDFLEARWIETGVDLKDDVMGTINRYIRFQLTATLRERN